MGDPEDPGGGAYEESSSAPSVASADKVAAHLAKVSAVVLEEDGANGAAVATLNKVLTETRNLDLVAKFCGDPHCKTLLVERFGGAKEEEQEEEGAGAPAGAGAGAGGGGAGAQGPGSSGGALMYNISLNVHFSNSRAASIVFVKRSAMVEAEKSVGAQLRVLSLSDGSPYETLHSYVSTAVAPYFKSFVRESGKADRDGDKMATSMEKKIAELEMGLLHLQQNIDIPEITLTVHPLILQVGVDTITIYDNLFSWLCFILN